jgi:hypothetical protein
LMKIVEAYKSLWHICPALTVMLTALALFLVGIIVAAFVHK